MGLQTVLLVDETEKGLTQVTKKTGRSASTMLKRGVLVLRDEVRRRNQRSTFEIYRRLDLGPGGYAIAPSTDTRRGMQLALRGNETLRGGASLNSGDAACAPGRSLSFDQTRTGTRHPQGGGASRPNHLRFTLAREAGFTSSYIRIHAPGTSRTCSLRALLPVPMLPSKKATSRSDRLRTLSPTKKWPTGREHHLPISAGILRMAPLLDPLANLDRMRSIPPAQSEQGDGLMKTLAGTVHQGRVELDEKTELVEGQTVIVVVPENQEAHLPAEAMKVLVRLDAFRSEVGPVGCATRDLVRQGRRNDQ